MGTVNIPYFIISSLTMRLKLTLTVNTHTHNSLEYSTKTTNREKNLILLHVYDQICECCNYNFIFWTNYGLNKYFLLSIFNALVGVTALYCKVPFFILCDRFLFFYAIERCILMHIPCTKWNWTESNCVFCCWYLIEQFEMIEFPLNDTSSFKDKCMKCL